MVEGFQAEIHTHTYVPTFLFILKKTHFKLNLIISILRLVHGHTVYDAV